MGDRLPGVAEPVRRPRRDGHRVAGPGQDRAAAQPEPHAPLDERELLLLHGMSVASRNMAPRGQEQVEGEEPALRVAAALPDHDPFSADGVDDDAVRALVPDA